MTRPEGVVVILRRPNGRFLVIRRGPEASNSGYWAPMSGRIEPGETQEQTVVREVREELGIAVTPDRKVWECPTDDGKYLLHWWTADAPADDRLTPDPGEVSETRWVTAAEYFDLEPTFAGDHAFFARILPGLESTAS